MDLGVDVEAAEGYLPEDVVDQVSAQDLDTSLLTVSLRGYQEFGAQYALVQGRTILGDEMGLGKTIQAIAVMAHLGRRRRTALPRRLPRRASLRTGSARSQPHCRCGGPVLHGRRARRRLARLARATAASAIITFDAARAPATLPGGPRARRCSSSTRRTT